MLRDADLWRRVHLTTRTRCGEQGHAWTLENAGDWDDIRRKTTSRAKWFREPNRVMPACLRLCAS